MKQENYKFSTPSKNDYYILFLDEADLGYHPDWKRTYVSSIIDFCKSFFFRTDSARAHRLSRYKSEIQRDRENLLGRQGK